MQSVTTNDNTQLIFPQQLYVGYLSQLQNKPALIPNDRKVFWVIAHDEANFSKAAGFFEGIALQMLLDQPPGSARLTLFEPEPSPEFAQLKRVFAQTDRDIGQQLLSTEALHEHISKLTTLAHQRYSLLAAAQVDDYLDYNLTVSPEKCLTIEYLLLAGVLATDGMERDLAALAALCKSGPKVGIIPLLLYGDQENDKALGAHAVKPLKKFWANVWPLSQGFSCTTSHSNPAVENYCDGHNLPLELYRLICQFTPYFGMTIRALHAYGDAIISKSTAQHSQSTQKDFFRVLIGHEGLKPTHFCLGEASQTYHVMIGGATRSGKSTLLDNILVQSCELYSPAQLQWWLFDFKAVGFAAYRNLAHVKKLYLNDGVAALPIEQLEQFEALLLQRTRLFLAANVTRLEEYNEVASKDGFELLPRHILMVDEAQDLFTNRDLKLHAKRVLAAVARKGAGLGIHFILITQSFQNVDLDNDTKSQIRLRLGLQLASSMECRALMGRENTAPLTLPRFSAVLNNNFGEESDNRIVQLLPLARTDLFQRLEALKHDCASSQIPTQLDFQALQSTALPKLEQIKHRVSLTPLDDL